MGRPVERAYLVSVDDLREEDWQRLYPPLEAVLIKGMECQSRKLVEESSPENSFRLA